MGKPELLRRYRMPVAGVGAVLAVVIVIVVVGVRGCGREDTVDSVGGPFAAARTADREPRGPFVRNIPFDCGMSPALIVKLTPRTDKTENTGIGRDACTWGEDTDSWGSVAADRSLEVEVRTADGGESSTATGTAIDDFTRMLDESVTNTIDAEIGPVTPLTGLGDEAVAWTRVAETHREPRGGKKRKPKLRYGTAGTEIAFRAGNVVVRVAYGGVDHTEDGVDLAGNPLPEKETLNGAVTAATQVARSMRIPVRGTPRAAPRPDGRTVDQVPQACDLVPAAVVKEAIPQPEPTPTSDESYLYGGEGTEDVEGVTSGACSWDAGTAANLEVDIVSASDDAPAGPGSAVAAREYLRLYHDGRDSRAPGNTFTALRGIGDQAFAYYRRDEITKGAEAVAAFRVRNVLVRTRCWSVSAYSAEDALNCAFLSARAAAKKVGR